MIWLLAIDLGVAVWYFATEPAGPVDGSGLTRGHRATLAQPQISYMATPGGDSAMGDFSAQVEFIIPESISQLEARGVPTVRGRAEVSLWTPGTPYEAREVIAAGFVVLDGLPLAGEVVSVSLEPLDPEDTGTWPPVDAEVVPETMTDAVILPSTTTTFTPANNVNALLYPWVFGRPGLRTDEDGADVDSPGSPALLIQVMGGLQRVLIAGHPVASGTVTLYSEVTDFGVGPFDTFAVEQVRDGRGQIVSTCDVSGKAILWNVEDDNASLWVAGWAGAIEWDDGEELRGLGSICLYLLRSVNSGDIFNLGAWQAACYELNTVEVGGYIDSAIVPWEMISKELRPLFPRMTVLWGIAGYYPVIFEDIDPSSTPELIENIHVALPDGQRATDEQNTGNTSVRIEYSRSPPNDGYLDSITIGPGYTDQVAELGSGVSRRAYSWVGKRETWTLSTPWLWRHDSAAYVAREWLDVLAEPLPVVELLLLEPLRRRGLPIGAGVRVTVERLGWSARPCWIVGHRFDGPILYISVQARPRRL